MGLGSLLYVACFVLGDVVLYCPSPSEESSARAALLLHRNGILHVRPLLGGFDAWRERNYPTEAMRAADVSMSA